MIEESRLKLEAAYASEAAARRQAEAAEEEAQNALDLANCSLDVMQITTTSLGHGQLSVGLPATDEPRFSSQLSLGFSAVDSPEFKAEMVRNQGLAERIAYHIEEAMLAMKRGTKARTRVTAGRWQGYYDMILGRLLAIKVRCYEYNWACAIMKRNPPRFENPKSNAWRLVPSEVISYSEKAKAAAKEATVLLRRVVDEHPGTPWAMMARGELRDPLGFKWVETYVDPFARDAQASGRTEKPSPWYLQRTQLNIATRLAKQGLLEEARKALSQVGDLTPGAADASEVIKQRGELSAVLGLWDRAAADYSESVRLRPEDPFTRKSPDPGGSSRPASARRRAGRHRPA